MIAFALVSTSLLNQMSNLTVSTNLGIEEVFAGIVVITMFVRLGLTLSNSDGRSLQGVVLMRYTHHLQQTIAHNALPATPDAQESKVKTWNSGDTIEYCPIVL
ncbi:hypothetical protein ANCCEY_11168 [Ancylostoma ceylanicum]|uniref:Uncharacterized protein n=1 Tax=Ancylostoma ceylanicum TaxID=53326 RepID=A0A0D6LCX7_9BILA|nr:hypothetical protein ANCCEY_11168 [Ancylostoma ceylanicum]